MIENQGIALLNVSEHMALAGSYSVLQYSSNLMIIAGALIDKYNTRTLKVKPYFNDTENYVNGQLFDMKQVVPRGYDTATNKSLETGIWYLNPYQIFPQQLSNPSLINLKSASIFDSFLRPMASLSNRKFPYFSESFIGYASDGLFYSNPAGYGGFLVFKDLGRSCIYNLHRPPQYDPRCRPWYQAAKNATNKNWALLTEPYTFSNTKTLGQTACRGIWIGNSMQAAVCIDYFLTSIDNHIRHSLNGTSAYCFALDLAGKVIIHPNLNRTIQTVPPIEVLEFGQDAGSEEGRDFHDKILPKFLENKSSLQKYYKDGQKMVIAISPINLQMAFDQDNQVHYISIAIVIPESAVYEKIIGLKEDCKNMMYVEIAIFIATLIVIGFICWYLTNVIASSIVAPIDKLLDILIRLTKHDLSLDVKSQYTPGPPEMEALYEVFDKMRLVLRLRDSSNFKQDAQAIMNYSQALSLYENFGNKKAMEMCYTELGNIHLRNEQFLEAATSYYNSYLIIKQTYGFSERLLAKRKVQTARAMLLARVRTNEGIELFEEALNYYRKSLNSTETLFCLIDYAEGLLADGKSPEKILNEAEFILQKRPADSLQDILMQRHKFYLAIHLENQKKLMFASDLYLSCIENYQYFDPIIRKKAIKRLMNIFESQNLPLDELKRLLNTVEEKQQDFAIVIDSKLSSPHMHENLIKFINDIVESRDRISIINFDQDCKVLFNLTKRSSKDIKFPENRNSSGKSVLLDGISEAYRQIMACNFYIADSHLEGCVTNHQ